MPLAPEAVIARRPLKGTVDVKQKGEPPVVIIGGGMGGLVLARVLQRHGKPAVVYEAEGSREEQDRQGGTLDMHEESGQWALAQVGG